MLGDYGDEMRSPPTRDPRLVLVALSLGFGVVQLDVTAVNVAVNRIAASIGGDIQSMQWVVSAYTVTLAAFIISAGAAGDRLGARRLFLAGFVLFTSASAACAVAPNIGVLIAARAVQGVGAAVLVPCSLALLNHAFHDPARRRWAVGWWAAGASIALAAGPLAGGVLIAVAGWRAIFLINLPLGALAIALTLRCLTETPRDEHRGIDAPGQLLGTLALGLLAAATIEGGARGFARPIVLAGYAVFVIAAAGFVAVESRTRRPMLPLSLFAHRVFALTTLIGLLINVCVYGLIFVFSLVLQRRAGLSPLGAGVAFLPMTVAVGVANVLAGRLTRRYAPRALIGAGLLLMAAACVALRLGADTAGPVSVAVVLVALGGGAGIVVPLVTAELLGSVDRRHSGVAAATLNSSRQTGSVVGVALFGALIASSSLVAGAGLALVISVGALIAAGAAAARLPA
jgi:DHA2 family methylenomycin A resistance protein-like MFS transporter